MTLLVQVLYILKIYLFHRLELSSTDGVDQLSQQSEVDMTDKVIQLEKSNSKKQSALVKIAAEVAEHMNVINEVLDRYKAVDEDFRKEEDILTAFINEAELQLNELQVEKSSIETRLQQENEELQQHEEYLHSAGRKYDEANRKLDEKKKVVVVTAGFAAALTFGLSALAIQPAIQLLSQEVDEAKEDIHRCHQRIEDALFTLRHTKGAIESVSNVIETVKTKMESHQEKLNVLKIDKEKVNKILLFLTDAQVYGTTYADGMSSDRFSDLHEYLEEQLEEKSYSLFDDEGDELLFSSFEKAWCAFQQMNAKEERFILSVKFTCSQCDRHCYEFPQVNDGELVCNSCYNDN